MGKIAFIFPGQGAQYVGMGLEFYNNIPESREIFERANMALGFDIANLCFKGSKEELDKTENTQPAILSTSIAALKALESYGIKAEVTAGLSLGEYSALVYSGVLGFEEAVTLVKKRGGFMQEAVPQGVGGMAAIIGLKSEDIYDICKECSAVGVVEPANFNCPGQIVIAGETKALDKAMELSKIKGAIKVVKLDVSGPFHSSMLKNAAIKLEKELEPLKLNTMNIPVVTNVTGDFMEGQKIKSTLKNQVMSSVKWEHTIKNMMEQGVDTFIEIGPGKTLSTFVKKINRKAIVANVEDLKSLSKALEIINKDN